MANNNKLYGLGRRKTAIAQVTLTDDAKSRVVNDLSFEQYFPTIAMQQAALQPLTAASLHETHGFKAKIQGGGKQSQAGALKLAIARAIVEKDAAYRKQLKDTGALTRDPRMKERKKCGLKRARRAPQFSKR